MSEFERVVLEKLERLDQIDGRLARLETGQAKLAAGQESLDRKVDALSNHVQDLTEVIREAGFPAPEMPEEATG